MWLVNGVGIVVTELMHDFGDSIMVAFSEGRPDGGLETVRVFRQLCSASVACIHCSGLPKARTSYVFSRLPFRYASW